MKKEKVGIMGGTFDPIHIGHLILGEKAYEQFKLDKILFMPSGNPPHKQNRNGLATLSQRIEMVRLAISDNPHFELSLEEAHEAGYTYTKETLERLSRENPNTEYYFIMGADSLFQFDEWNDPGRIAQLAVLVVAVRNHVTELELDEAVAHVQNKYGANVQLLSTPNIDVSSKMLRNWAENGKSLRYYLTDNVMRYIADTGLYQK